jgi:peptidyl-prolyl cis-trans isomerase C
MIPSLNRRLLTVAAVVLLAMRSFAGSPDAVLATLGPTPIRESDFTFFLQGMFSPEERATMNTNSVARQEALEAYLDLTALAAKARRDGIDRSTTFRKARELMELKLLARLLTERERERFLKAAAVTDQELRDYYDRHPERFQVPPNFTVRQVLLYVKGNPAFPEQGHDDAEAAARAQKALDRLRAGESWETVAKECSDDKVTGRRGGLLEDGRFGYFPPEMEAAIRQQEIGKPGDVVKSQFGYHVLQVEQRTLEGERQTFASVKGIISMDVSNEKISAAHRDYLEPIRAAVKLEETPLAARDTFVLGPPGIKTNDVLATLNGAPIYEADFEWFARDAYRSDQREQAFSRPGARRGMVKTYLNMRALEARARQLGIDQTPEFRAVCHVEEMKLLGEFLQERDQTTPWKLPGATEEARAAALKSYMNGVRAEMNLRTVSR